MVGISKVILTRVIGQGHDALMADVPQLVVETVRLASPGLLAPVTTD
jgi:hypothetical protein